MEFLGLMPGSSSKEPAGIMRREPLRVSLGSGAPQVVQKLVEKLFASGRSNRTTFSLPAIQHILSGEARIFEAWAVPVAF
jgi:hypothetical protein